MRDQRRSESHSLTLRDSLRLAVVDLVCREISRLSAGLDAASVGSLEHYAQTLSLGYPIGFLEHLQLTLSI